MTNLTLSLPDKLINNRYYLYKPIANSNHSQVFVTRDFIKHRKCVVKRLDLNFCSEKIRQTRASMFEQEAKILQQLSGKHAQIVQFYDYFRDDSSLYLVQEWIAGTTLTEKLHQQKKLSESDTRNILLNLLPVLEYLHKQGIVHGDIKPNNIVLRSQDNLPVLIDFGIAQLISNREAWTESNREASTLGYPQGLHSNGCNRHQLRVIAGTPGYMSSEQAMGQATYSNDLYSLALTAIHLLTGRSPLNLDFNCQESISPNLLEVLSRAISPQPERRFASAAQMRSALLSSPSTVLLTRGHKSPLKTWMFLILGLQVFIALMGWQYLAAKLDERPPVKFADLFPEESVLLTETENDVAPTKDDTAPIKNDATKNIFQGIIFTVGTSDREILQALGKPVWRQPGFWKNSVAWSYKNIVSQGIDLGYLFDVQTNKLRQAEIAVPPSTSLKTLQAALISLSSAKIEPNLEQGLKAVYQRRQTVYNFAVGDLQGTIQRNQQDRIYMAVWSADFH